jgi:hypothetical protein
LKVLDNSNPAYNAKSSIKIFKKIYFCSNCGTWANARHTVARKMLTVMWGMWKQNSRFRENMVMPVSKSSAVSPARGKWTTLS